MSNNDIDAPLGTGRALGKLILIGEHAVVYGAPALAVPVEAVAATASVWPTGQAAVGLAQPQAHAMGPQLDIEAFFPGYEARDPIRCNLASDGPLPAVARAALAHLGDAAADIAWQVTLESTVPPGRGLGSSAAVAVALARALLAAGGRLEPDLVADAALAGEREVHGRPSGIDHWTILYGRPTWLEQGRPQELAVGQALDFVIGDTGARGSTGDLVTALAKRRAERPQTFVRWGERIAGLAVEARRAMGSGQREQLGRLFDANHLVLQAMRLSTPALDSLVAAARRNGAWGAKLSGAGGGGVMFALAPAQRLDEVESALQAAGAQRTWRSHVPATERAQA